MTINQNELQKIYPSATLVTNKANDSAIYLPVSNGFMRIDSKQLSASEKQLLSLMAQGENPQIDFKHHPWIAFLTGNGQRPARLPKQLRFVQFHVTFLDEDADRQEWLTALTSMFNQVSDSCFLTPDSGVIIEPFSESHYHLADSNSILQTIDADFFSKTQLYLGHFWNGTDELTQLFQEEQAIFASERPDKQISLNLAAVALHYFSEPKMSQSNVAQVLKSDLGSNLVAMSDVIKALYQNQGNISSAAKQLFVHRNTLQYRLDRFAEQTGFFLRDMNDLVFCYLLISD